MFTPHSDPRLSFVRCQICASSKFTTWNTQMVLRDHLFDHIAEHLNYRPLLTERNERLERICRIEYGECVVMSFAEQLNQLNGGSRRRSNNKKNSTSFQHVPPFTSLSFPNHSNALPLPVVPPPRPPSTSFSSSLTVRVLSTSPNSGGPMDGRGVRPTDVQTALRIGESSTCSKKAKVDNEEPNNNDAESILFYNNLRQQMTIEAAENVSDYRQQAQQLEDGAEDEREGGAKGRKRLKKGKKKGMTKSGGQTEGMQAKVKVSPNNSNGGNTEQRIMRNKELAGLVIHNSLWTVDRRLDRSCKRSATHLMTPRANHSKKTKSARDENNAPTPKGTRGRKSTVTLGATTETTQSPQTHTSHDDNNNNCICGKSLNAKSKFLVGCSKCQAWFHGTCVKITLEESKRIPFWLCVRCQNEQQKAAHEQQKDEDDDIQQLFCTCLMPDTNESYVGCDGCNEWYHPKCIGTSQARIDALGDAPFSCPTCNKRPKKWFLKKKASVSKREPEEED